MFELVIKGEFSAAHHLRGYKGKCENLHGHNYGVELYIQQETLDKPSSCGRNRNPSGVATCGEHGESNISGQGLGKLGMAVDFTILKKSLDQVMAEYDHHYLNELKDFAKLNPTAENIAYMIHCKIAKKLPKTNKINPHTNNIGVRVKVCIWESSKAGACYSPTNY